MAKRNTRYPKYLLPAFALGLVLLGYVITTRRQSLSINEIGTVSAMCDPQIVKLQQSCKVGKYRYAQYRCHTKDTTHTTGSAKTCQSRIEWLSTIQSECAQTSCGPKSSFQPSPAPSGCVWVTTQCLVAPCPIVLQCASPSPSPTGIPAYCYPKSIQIYYQEQCGSGEYRYAKYKCYETDSERVMGGSSSCKSLAAWNQEVQYECSLVCPFPSTPPSSPRPTSSPK